MNANLVRTLPIRVRPLPGEGLDSWLEATGARLGVKLGQLVAALSSPRSPSAGRANDVTHRWTVLLHASQADFLSAATGTAAADLHAMTLACFDGTALLIDHARHQINRRRLWGRQRGSRFCPQCLAENGGRWPLSWRLGWSFACLHHQCLLADMCASCGRMQRQHPYAAHCIPRPGHCMNTRAPGAAGPSSERCGFPLSEVRTPQLAPDHPALSLQRTLLLGIEQGRINFGVYGDQPPQVSMVLSDMRSFAGRILSFASREDLASLLPTDLLHLHEQAAQHPHRRSTYRRAGFMAPPHAATTAVGLAAAAQILDRSDIHEAGAMLRGLTRTGTDGAQPLMPNDIAPWGGEGTSTTLRSVQLSSLIPRMKATSKLRHRTAAPAPIDPAPASSAEQRAAGMPSMIWTHWALPLTPLHRTSLHTLRMAMPCWLLTSGIATNLQNTTALLGTLLENDTLSTTLHELHISPHWDSVHQALIRLTDFLDAHPPPINYQRRRRLDYTELLPKETWLQACERAGVNRGLERKHRLAQCYLFERLSTLPAARAPATYAITDGHLRPKLVEFPRNLTPRLADELDRAGADFLAAHAPGEPVTWEPSLPLQDLTLTGPDPDSIDIDRLHHLIRNENLTTRQAADRLATTSEVVRYLLTRHPAPPSPSQQRAAGAAAADLKRRLPAARLEELRRTHTLAEIASQFGTNRTMIKKLSKQYDLPDRSHGRPRRHPEVNRGWLSEQYLKRRRPLPELAREAGMSTSQMSRQAQKLGIPLRRPGGASHAAVLQAEARAANAPRVLRPVLTGRHARQRLARYAVAIKYDTLTEAAIGLGMAKGHLINQIGMLEAQLGASLLTRAQRGHPMKPTSLGRQVLTAMKRLGITPEEAKPRKKYPR